MTVRKAVGEVRPSQVITTFGPGAIVDLQTLSIIVSGVDAWQIDDSERIQEARLQRALGVKCFYSPRPGEGDRFARIGTIPAQLFPRFQVCPQCQTLSELGDGLTEYDDRRGEVLCKAPGCPGRGKRRSTTLPAPFIVACPGGHVDDFPWREYVHRGATNCREKLTLYSAGETGALADIRIKCACGNATRSPSDAFGERRDQALGLCTGKRPWLGLRDTDPAPCKQASEFRAMQRGATNGWFPIVKSALAVQEAATPVGLALARCDPAQIANIDSQQMLAMLLGAHMFPSLEPFPIADVWHCIQRTRGELETSDADLRRPEWAAFCEPTDRTNDTSEFFLEPAITPAALEHLIETVVLVRKLLEVRVLTGFTRVDAGVTGVDSKIAMAPIAKRKLDWLPGVELRGEGIFIRLREGALRTWEAQDAVLSRTRAIRQKLEEWQRDREIHAPVDLAPRFVLLHTLAHLLVRQLALDCGYSASSVRERIYASADVQAPMAGILIYTASPDSDGSLGGLVDLGREERLGPLLLGALQSAERCSSDPLCAAHQPDVHGSLNGAACHACALVAETSCESFNRVLDRSLVVPTMATREHAYFGPIR